MKKVITVFGPAKGEIDEEVARKAREVGKEIAKKNCILLTGACDLVPHEAAKGAKEEEGIVVGVSPAENLKEHVEVFKLPTDSFDLIIYTGFGYKGRNVITVRSADAVVAISGRIGTLNELTIAYDEGKPIGILDVPGTSIKFPEIVRESGKRGPHVFVEENPSKLIENLLKFLG